MLSPPPKQVLDRVEHVMSENPDVSVIKWKAFLRSFNVCLQGLSIGSFVAQYRALFGTSLNPNHLGYSDTVSLLRTLPSVSEVRAMGQSSYFIVPVTGRRLRKIKTVGKAPQNKFSCRL